MSAWQSIDTAPKDRRILVRNPAGAVHCAEWATSIDTDENAWRVSVWHGGNGEFNCLLVPNVHEWADIPE